MRLVASTREFSLLLPPIFCFLLTGLAWAYHQRPYQVLITEYATSTGHLSSAQRQNVMAAARRLDGAIIAAGQRCSFNDLVGPRSIARGFTEANAYMEGLRTRSLGGGVCQLSSTLYAALQETTLPIVKRVAHGVVVRSVPPGRDAAVWYGQADLVFDNTFERPLRIRARVEGAAVHVELWGNGEANQRAALRFSYRHGRARQDRVVWVFRHFSGKDILLSHDTYKLAADTGHRDLRMR